MAVTGCKAPTWEEEPRTGKQGVLRHWGLGEGSPGVSGQYLLRGVPNVLGHVCEQLPWAHGPASGQRQERQGQGGP